MLLFVAAVLLTAATNVFAQSPRQPGIHLLDVPYIEQSEALCGGAAAAMVMRYWGATGVYAETFEPLVDRTLGGIRGADLLRDLAARGWQPRSFQGDRPLVAARLADGQPVVALIEDRPGFFHFVVIVAWTNGRVVYHDPARAPFRVAAEKTFLDAWTKADRWTMLLLPPEGGVGVASDTDRPAETSVSSPCDDMVARGVRAAESGDRAGAMDVLTAAADACPAASAALREAAGVRALEENWPEAGRLASAAVQRNARDEHAWRILATSAYVTGDPARALDAWNRAGEPRIDLVSVHGLERTRHAAASSLLGLEAGSLLSSRALAAARRRLAELPSAEIARVNYRPLGNGLAAVDAVVVERPLWPVSRASLVAIGARMASDRELAASAASLSGGGDLLSASWRWWRNRPRLELAYSAPSAAGVWRAEVFGEEQTYGPAASAVSEPRRGGSLTLAGWTPSLLRWELGAGVDSWEGQGRTAVVRAAVDQRLGGDRTALRADASIVGGAFAAAAGGASAEWRSHVSNEGTVWLAGLGAVLASAKAPRAFWAGAGTGHARGPLLRAHPLLDDGRITGAVFGRRLYHAGSEVRRWLAPVLKVVRIAPAVFVDMARADDRLVPGAAWHADAGAGLRVAVPGSGLLRVDVGKGLRDGATNVSIAWTR